MSIAGRQFPFRTILTFLAIIAIIWYSKQQRLAPSTMSKDVLSHLAVSVRKSASQELTFSVTNNHDTPITFLKWESPLDLSVLKLGGVKLFAPADSDDALDIPTIQIRRKMPPDEGSLVTFEPGETKEQSIELKEPVVPIDKLKGDVMITVQGRWVSVWQKRVDEISPKELEELNTGDEAVEGEYSIEPVVVHF